MKVLHIKVSHNGEKSKSRLVSESVLKRLNDKKGPIQETIMDLSVNPIPHLSSESIESFFVKPEQRSDAQKRAASLSDSLVDQLFAHDLILISSPMWNLGLPSVLKAWFDHITRAGRTFAFTSEGTKVGLVKNKKVIAVVSSGSVFSEGPFVNDDQFSPYIKKAFEYIGVNDVELLRVEGTATPQVAPMAVSDALARIETIYF